MKNIRDLLKQAAVLALLCASLTTFASNALAQEGTFVPTGSMSTARESHTATLLSSGKVLIAGGTTAPPWLVLSCMTPRRRPSPLLAA